MQQRSGVACSVVSTESDPLLDDLFTPPALITDRYPPSSFPMHENNPCPQFDPVQDLPGPPAAQPRRGSFVLDEPAPMQEEGGTANRKLSPPSSLVEREEAAPQTPADGNRTFAWQSALQDLFETQEADEAATSNLAPISSVFKANEYSLHRRRKNRHSRSQHASNPDLEDYPRLTFTTRSTPSPSKNAQSRRPYVSGAGLRA